MAVRRRVHAFGPELQGWRTPVVGRGRLGGNPPKRCRNEPLLPKAFKWLMGDRLGSIAVVMACKESGRFPDRRGNSLSRPPPGLYDATRLDEAIQAPAGGLQRGRGTFPA